jgi:hypothetical protein
LSFITATDQAKFEQLFKSAAGGNQALDGDKARDLLLRSKLPGSALSQIWILSDTTKSGQLLFPEFALAMYLCNLKLTGQELPAALPDRMKNEVSSMVDIISSGIPDDKPSSAPVRSNIPNFDAPLRQNAEAAVGDIQYIEVFAEAPGKTAVAELVGSSAVAVRRVESPLPVVVVTDQGNRLAAARKERAAEELVEMN